MFIFPRILSNQEIAIQDILQCLSFGVATKSGYNANVRAFCLKLHYLSPSAYEFLRSQFNDHLPHVKTITSWYRHSSLDAEPGINEASLKMLEEQAKTFTNRTNKQAICSLTFDEMAIKKHQQWCFKTSKFYGGVTYGNTEATEETANNAIVFLVNGINAHIKVPIAYHLITSIAAQSRLELLTQVIKSILERGVLIANITFDGLGSNATMCEMLGAKLDPFDLRPYFIEPSKGHKIQIILDPSHCIKLVRNNFANNEILYDDANRKIEWKYIRKLVEFGKNSDFSLTHKINKRHIEFANRIMHVRTAVQTLSSSVANSLEYLQTNNVAAFAHAGATIHFIRTFDHLFDILNTQRVINKNTSPFKSAMNANNIKDVLEFFKTAKTYILGLQLRTNNGYVPVVKSRIKTGFRGILINIESVSSMYTKYVQESQTMQMLATYRLSQDHLEMFFRKIRGRCGNNDNPTVLQFQYSYRRLQMITDLPLIGEANISDLSDLASPNTSNILTISSSSTKNNNREAEADPAGDEDDEINTIEQINQHEHLLDINCNDSAISFVAHKIEQRLLSCEQIYCESCRKALMENEKNDHNICIGKSAPCKSTYDICKLTDHAIKQFLGGGNKTDKAFGTKVMQYVFQKLNIDHVFSRHFTIDHDISHKFFIIKFIINEYKHIKCQFISKQNTLSMHEHFIRQKNLKLVHFAGQ